MIIKFVCENCGVINELEIFDYLKNYGTLSFSCEICGYEKEVEVNK